jgi:hypothetical protein
MMTAFCFSSASRLHLVLFACKWNSHLAHDSMGHSLAMSSLGCFSVKEAMGQSGLAVRLTNSAVTSSRAHP